MLWAAVGFLAAVAATSGTCWQSAATLNPKHLLARLQCVLMLHQLCIVRVAPSQESSRGCGCRGKSAVHVHTW